MIQYIVRFIEKNVIFPKISKRSDKIKLAVYLYLLSFNVLLCSVFIVYAPVQLSSSALLVSSLMLLLLFSFEDSR